MRIPPKAEMQIESKIQGLTRQTEATLNIYNRDLPRATVTLVTEKLRNQTADGEPRGQGRKPPPGWSREVPAGMKNPPDRSWHHGGDSHRQRQCPGRRGRKLPSAPAPSSAGQHRSWETACGPSCQDRSSAGEGKEWL